MSRYLVLGQISSEERTTQWEEIDVTDAAHAEAAVRKLAEQHTSYPAFLAVPERSYRPLKVERTQVVQTKLSPAKANPGPSKNGA